MRNKNIIEDFHIKIKESKEICTLCLILINKLEELLKSLELIEWALDEAPDVTQILWDYKNNEISSRFFKYFSLFEDIEELEEGFEILQRKNLNIYFISLMSLFEGFLNLLISLLSKNAVKLNFPITKEISGRKYEYFIDAEKDLAIKINDEVTNKIEFSNINQKIWCFHNLLNTKKPKPHRYLDKSDFEYYSIIRNAILHRDEEIVDLHLFPIYEDVKNEIFTEDNKILISKNFFYTCIRNLFNYCFEISTAFERLIRNHN